MAPDHIVELKKWASDLARTKDEVEVVRLNQAVELISKAYSVEPHEVAILGLTVDERSLRFLAPDNLRDVGQIPLSSGSALAARTVRERRGEIVNHFYVVPHASVFEGEQCSAHIMTGHPGINVTVPSGAVFRSQEEARKDALNRCSLTNLAEEGWGATCQTWCVPVDRHG